MTYLNMFLTIIISIVFSSEHIPEPTLPIVPPLALCKNLVQQKPGRNNWKNVPAPFPLILLSFSLFLSIREVLD